MTDWQSDAACKGMDREAFFPRQPKGGHGALKVCLSCPVRWDCLEDAMQWEAQKGCWRRFGIVGGTTGEQRTRLAKGQWVTLERTCPWCEQRFIPVQERAKFCTEKCGVRFAYYGQSRAEVLARGIRNRWTSTRS